MDVDSSLTGSSTQPGQGQPQPQQHQQQQVPYAGGPGIIAPQPLQPPMQTQPLQPQPLQHQPPLQPPQQPSLVGMIVPKGPVRTDFVPADASGTRFTLTLTSPGDLPWPLRQVNELVFFLTDPANSLKPDTGLLIYWQLRVPSTGQESGFELLGALWGSTKPSDVFRTGWAEHEQFISLEQQQQQQQLPGSAASASIVIGVSVEPLSTIQNVIGVDGNAMAQPWGGTGGGGGGGVNNASAGMQNGVPGDGGLFGMMSLNDGLANGGGGGGGTPVTTTTTNSNAHKIAEDLYNYMMSFDTGGATGNQTMVVPANIFDRWWTRFEAKAKRDPNFFLKNSN